MTDSHFYKDHWVRIDQQRLERYQKMFQWNPASSALYESADIGKGDVVVDFGCGPGHVAVEIANWVGRDGHVHGLDINREFIAQTVANAKLAGVSDRLTAHQCDGVKLPLADQSIDRLTSRNTMIYVDNPNQTIREFHRILKPGGKVHFIEGDWPMMVAEPVAASEWADFVNAASHATRTPDIGRKLYGLVVEAGFSNIQVQVIAQPDTTGKFLQMFKNMSIYAADSAKMTQAEADLILDTIEKAIEEGKYMALVPQFVVTAMR